MLERKIESDKNNEKHADWLRDWYIMIEKIIEIMSRVITKCQNDEYYTIIDNFQTNYMSWLFVGYILLLSINKSIFNKRTRKTFRRLFI